MSKNIYFKGPEEFHLLSDGLAAVMSVLNQGRTGPTPVAVHASRKGYRIVVAGFTIAKGKTPRELAENFKAAVAKAVSDHDAKATPVSQ